ncbi:ankyrin [Plakobranchus ocellatus]|uniref:Ankyrin n=1 Tax=Plakobranchus ocellatus TaxID=259542 RepID=A0AAV4DA16_9GAST|nr:ankyrin [Plakobranchus ocellatus]
MAADQDKILEDLQSLMQVKKSSDLNISTLARQGTDKLVQDFLTDNVKIQSTGPMAKMSQLYFASFWGQKDSVRQLLEAGTNPNLQNEGTLWTPLHAATFQEHGPVVMTLLEYGAQPELPDSENRTPSDFASASDKIWPFFAALGVPRTSRAELVSKEILRPGSGIREERQPGYGINMADYKSSQHKDDQSNNFMAAMSGDVLADETDQFGIHDPRHNSQPQFSVWK